MRATMKWLCFVNLVVISTWGWLPAARAQWAPRGGGPCREDMEKFCKAASQERGQARQCMQEHMADLSPACREHLQGMQKGTSGREAMRTACNADADKFCKQLNPGQGGLYHCLKGHEAELSEACKSAIAGAPRGAAH